MNCSPGSITNRPSLHADKLAAPIWKSTCCLGYVLDQLTELKCSRQQCLIHLGKGVLNLAPVQYSTFAFPVLISGLSGHFARLVRYLQIVFKQVVHAKFAFTWPPCEQTQLTR